jgi:hypothetical protein
LPWTARGVNILDRRSGYVIWFDQDMKVDARIKADRDYIVHAANAYPKLVGLVQSIKDKFDVGSWPFNDIERILGELGEE